MLRRGYPAKRSVTIDWDPHEGSRVAMNNQIPEPPSELIDSLKTERACAVVGSGLSCAGGAPSWGEFLTGLAANAAAARPTSVTDLHAALEFIESGHCLKAADILREVLGPAFKHEASVELGRFRNMRVRPADERLGAKYAPELFDGALDDFRPRKIAPTLSHRILTQLPFRAIITTNYDDLLRLSNSPRYDDRIIAYDYPRLASYTARSTTPFILHLHGRVRDHFGMVLSRSDYTSLYHEYPTLIDSVGHLLSQYHPFWLGYGHSDPTLDNLIDRIVVGRGLDNGGSAVCLDDTRNRAWLRQRFDTVRVAATYLSSYDDTPRYLRKIAEHCGSPLAFFVVLRKPWPGDDPAWTKGMTLAAQLNDVLLAHRQNAALRVWAVREGDTKTSTRIGLEGHPGDVSLLRQMFHEHNADLMHILEDSNVVEFDELLVPLSEPSTTRRGRTPAEHALLNPYRTSPDDPGNITDTRTNVSPPPARPPRLVHQYRLIDQQRGLIGRGDLLSDLHRWRRAEGAASIQVLYAMGGTGKTALAWTFFTEAFSSNTPPCGGLWYSFYERGASFKQFLDELRTYVSEWASKGIGTPPEPESVDETFQKLRDLPFLIVLDGFERVLMAYHQPGGAAAGRQASTDDRAAQESSTHEHHSLTRGVSPLVDSFLASLTDQLTSRVLITTRLVPRAVLNVAGDPRPNVKVERLGDLQDDEAVELCVAYGLRDDREAILRVANRFGNHALLTKILAARVALDREHPRDLAAWAAAHPEFDPGLMSVTETQRHVLDYALSLLEPREATILHYTAALRGVGTYDDLKDLILAADGAAMSQGDLEAGLGRLDDLNLVAWDREANLYELHPLVSATVWQRMPGELRRSVNQTIVTCWHGPIPNNIERAKHVFAAFASLERYDDAWWFFSNHLKDFIDPLASNGSAEELLELLLLLMSKEHRPHAPLRARRDRASFLSLLAVAQELQGELVLAVDMFRIHRPLCRNAACPAHEARVLSRIGRFCEADALLRRVINHLRSIGDTDSEIAVLRNWAGLRLKVSDDPIEPVAARFASLIRTLGRSSRAEQLKSLLSIRISLAQEAHRRGERSAMARWTRLVNRARFTSKTAYETSSAAELLGDLHRERGEYREAYNAYTEAIEIARASRLFAEQPSLKVDLGECARRLGLQSEARELADEALNDAMRIGLPTTEARACLLLSVLAEDEGDRQLARTFAVKAYELAWCDGPPYAAIHLLNDAERRIRELGDEVPRGLPSAHGSGDEDDFEINPAEDLSSEAAPDDDLPWFDARRVLDLMLKAKGPSAMVERLLDQATEHHAAECYEYAVDLLTLAIDLDPFGGDLHAARGSSLWYAGKLDAALEDFSRAKQLGQNCAVNRGQLLALLNFGEQAVQELEAGRPHPFAYSGLGLAYAIVGRHEEAAASFHRAIKLVPGNSWAWFYHARALRLRGDSAALKKAVEAYRQASALISPPLPSWMKEEARVASA